MKVNFRILKSEDIFFGRGTQLQEIVVCCDKCQKEFKMHRKKEYDECSISYEYEYTYCPHCANELIDDEGLRI